jgi:hypothetical protein
MPVLMRLDICVHVAVGAAVGIPMAMLVALLVRHVLPLRLAGRFRGRFDHKTRKAEEIFPKRFGSSNLEASWPGSMRFSDGRFTVP